MLWGAVGLGGCKVSKTAGPPVPGCTDREAANYNPRANRDNGTCRYDQVQADFFCTHQDLARLTLGMSKTAVRDALGVYPYDIYGADNGCEVHVYRVKTAMQEVKTEGWERNQAYPKGPWVHMASSSKVHLFFDGGMLSSILSDRAASGLAADLACLANDMAELCAVPALNVSYVGCTDPGALNYNKSATTDNGTCRYTRGCTDPNAVNYNKQAVEDDGHCVYLGCGDPKAINYNPDALHNQARCKYCPCDTAEFFYILSDNPGCTDPCIKVKRSEAANFLKPECTWCELINQAGPASLQIQMDGVRVKE